MRVRTYSLSNKVGLGILGLPLLGCWGLVVVLSLVRSARGFGGAPSRLYTGCFGGCFSGVSSYLFTGRFGGSYLFTVFFDRL